MKILIVDDDATFRLVLGGMLEKLGHEAVYALDGAKGWGLLQKEHFPVVISDWQMPQIDGLQLTRMVRAKPAEQYTYIILITAHGAQQNYLEGIEAGADDYLPKPVDAQYLAARLHVAQRLIGVQEHMRQLESILSVCSYCKSVREPDNQWVAMEKYMRVHSGVMVSHGICPKCWVTRVQPELERWGIQLDNI